MRECAARGMELISAMFFCDGWISNFEAGEIMHQILFYKEQTGQDINGVNIL
jgi:hypothetical protein